MRVTTTRCAVHKHPEFVLEANESVPESHLADLVETIETMVAGGSVFKPEQTFQIGWMITKVVRFDKTRLTLVEPDMEAMPMRWVPGVTETLRQKMVQVYTLDSFSLREEMTMATAFESMVVCTKYTANEFFMSRSEPDGRDSGWFVGCLGQDHDHNDAKNLKCISLYEAYLNQRGIQNFLLFPVGAMVVNDTARGLTVRDKNGSALKLVPGSFLDAWFNQQSGS
jgi:hypothetical protein